MTLEDLKKEMQAYINTPCYFGAHEAKRDLTQHWLRKLEAIDLPDPDEKLPEKVVVKELPKQGGE
jgi:hypothetical protein